MDIFRDMNHFDISTLPFLNELSQLIVYVPTCFGDVGEAYLKAHPRRSAGVRIDWFTYMDAV